MERIIASVLLVSLTSFLFFGIPKIIESIIIYFANVTNTSLTQATILVLIILIIEFKIAFIVARYSVNKRRNKE